MFRNYGEIGFFAALFINGMLITTVVTNSSSNPRIHVMNWVYGVLTLRQCIVRISCQLVGGLLGYQLARVLWMLELYDGHSNRLSRQCTSNLTIPVPLGFLLECSVAMYYIWISSLNLTQFHWTERAVKHAGNCYLVILGVLLYIYSFCDFNLLL